MRGGPRGKKGLGGPTPLLLEDGLVEEGRVGGSTGGGVEGGGAVVEGSFLSTTTSSFISSFSSNSSPSFFQAALALCHTSMGRSNPPTPSLFGFEAVLLSCCWEVGRLGKEVPCGGVGGGRGGGRGGGGGGGGGGNPGDFKRSPSLAACAPVVGAAAVEVSATMPPPCCPSQSTSSDTLQ